MLLFFLKSFELDDCEGSFSLLIDSFENKCKPIRSAIENQLPFLYKKLNKENKKKVKEMADKAIDKIKSTDEISVNKLFSTSIKICVYRKLFAIFDDEELFALIKKYKLKYQHHNNNIFQML